MSGHDITGVGRGVIAHRASAQIGTAASLLSSRERGLHQGVCLWTRRSSRAKAREP